MSSDRRMEPQMLSNPNPGAPGNTDEHPVSSRSLRVLRAFAVASSSCGLLVLAAVLAVSIAGCKVDDVRRADEVKRFKQYLTTQSSKLDPQVKQTLSMGQCEQIAIANSLELMLQTMSLRIADDNVKLALTGALPKANISYTDTVRSNSNLMNQGGQKVKTGDRNVQNLSIGATVPILDWGLTYYSYQIAKDQKKQDTLLLQRSVQLLVRDVRVAYAEHAGAVRQQKFLEQALQASKEVLRVARSLQAAGETVHADTSLVEATVAQAEVDVAIAQKHTRDTHLTLSQLMSLPPASEFTIYSELPTLLEVPTLEQVYGYADRALEARPELAVQDLQRHISAYAVKQQATAFFPRVDGIGGFNWTNNSQAVNPNWFAGGIQVSNGLLNGGADIVNYSIAKTQRDIQEQKTLLVSLGVIYEVEMRALRIKETAEVMRAAHMLEDARSAGMERILSLYKEGLQDEAGAASALEQLTRQATTLDQAQTQYLISWYELEATVLPEKSFFYVAPTTRPVTRPTTQSSPQRTQRTLGMQVSPLCDAASLRETDSPLVATPSACFSSSEQPTAKARGREQTVKDEGVLRVCLRVVAPSRLRVPSVAKRTDAT